MTPQEQEEMYKLMGDPQARTNKSRERIALEIEEETLKAGEKAVNLSLIPQDQHHLYDLKNVTVPPDVLAILAECEYPLSKEEVHMIEKKMDRFHNIAKTSAIGMSLAMQQTGKPNIQLPQLISEGIATGFEYYHYP
jgi:hypothetical protein